MDTQTRERFFLPIAIPLGAIVFIAVLAISISKILLNVPKEIATAVALMAAFNVLVVCAFFALKKHISMMEVIPMVGVAFLPLLLGGLVASGAIEVKGEEGHATEEKQVVEIVASNITFNTAELKVPAGVPFSLKFTNAEAVPHNVAILKQKDSPQALLREEPFAGPKTVTWEVKALEAGSYFFQCDLHPNMSGSVVAESSATNPAGKQEAVKVEIAANNIAFDKQTLTVAAGIAFDLVFENLEKVPHNVAILKEKGSTEVLLRKDPFSGPKTVTWKVKPLGPGSYFFQCDLHPNMTGTIEAE